MKPHEPNPKDEDECLVSRMRSTFSDCESADESIVEGTDRWGAPAETRRSKAETNTVGIDDCKIFHLTVLPADFCSALAASISALISSSVISETPAALAASLISCIAHSARVALYSFAGNVMLNGIPFTITERLMNIRIAVGRSSPSASYSELASYLRSSSILI